MAIRHDRSESRRDEWWAEYAAAGPCADIWALNNSHFGGFAYSHWRYYHELALLAATRWAERCTPGCYGVSLVLEGFGLHFLTDAFSSGHAFNPLGDFETEDQRDVQHDSSTASLPDLAYPPPGGIDVFRQDIHAWLNQANQDGVSPAVQFADGFAGPLVIGDKLLPGLDDLAADEQATWVVARSRAAILDVWWALLGVRGEGGCVVTNMCTADYDQPSPEQGDAWRCVPFLSNASWDQALAAIGANEASLASWGDCSALDPAGHDCAWATSARALPSWPGSLDPEVDDTETLALLGCDLSDEQVYDNGRCTAGLGADEVRASVCQAHAAGACDFTGTCDLPWGVAADPDGGTTTTAECGCQATPHAPVPLAAALVFVLGGVLLGRRRVGTPMARVHHRGGRGWCGSALTAPGRGRAPWARLPASPTGSPRRPATPCARPR